MTDASKNPERIWLSPSCWKDERYWSEVAEADCDEPGCGAKAVEYIRADLARSVPTGGTEQAIVEAARNLVAARETGQPQHLWHAKEYTILRDAVERSMPPRGTEQDAYLAGARAMLDAMTFEPYQQPGVRFISFIEDHDVMQEDAVQAVLARQVPSQGTEQARRQDVALAAMAEADAPLLEPARSIPPQGNEQEQP